MNVNTPRVIHRMPVRNLRSSSFVGSSSRRLRSFVMLVHLRSEAVRLSDVIPERMSLVPDFLMSLIERRTVTVAFWADSFLPSASECRWQSPRQYPANPGGRIFQTLAERLERFSIGGLITTFANSCDPLIHGFCAVILNATSLSRENSA